MTDEEKRQQKANLLLEYQEAEDELAHLREQVSGRLKRMEWVVRWLKDYESSSTIGALSIDAERRNAEMSGIIPFTNPLN